MEEITLDATVENIGRVTQLADAFLEKVKCPYKTKVQIDIAIDELFGNIARYAYINTKGKVNVKIGLQENPKAVVVSFTDNGAAYNPLEHKAVNITALAEERTPGGLGIYIVKEYMDEIKYEYRDGQNILLIKKYL